MRKTPLEKQVNLGMAQRANTFGHNTRPFEEVQTLFTPDDMVSIFGEIGIARAANLNHVVMLITRAVSIAAFRLQSEREGLSASDEWLVAKNIYDCTVALFEAIGIDAARSASTAENGLLSDAEWENLREKVGATPSPDFFEMSRSDAFSSSSTAKSRFLRDAAWEIARGGVGLNLSRNPDARKRIAIEITGVSRGLFLLLEMGREARTRHAHSGKRGVKTDAAVPGFMQCWFGGAALAIGYLPSGRIKGDRPDKAETTALRATATLAAERSAAAGGDTDGLIRVLRKLAQMSDARASELIRQTRANFLDCRGDIGESGDHRLESLMPPINFPTKRSNSAR